MSKKASPSKKSRTGDGGGMKKGSQIEGSAEVKINSRLPSAEGSPFSIDSTNVSDNSSPKGQRLSNSSQPPHQAFSCKHAPSTVNFIKMYHLVARNLRWNGEEIKHVCGECGEVNGIILACLQCPTFGCLKAKKSKIKEDDLHEAAAVDSKINNNHFNLHTDVIGHSLGVEVHSGVVYCSVCNVWIWNSLLETSWQMACKSPSTATPSLIPFLETVESVEKEVATSVGNNSGIIKFQCRMIRGLYNLGNTCFMNSILQTMLHTRLFLSHFLSSPNTSHSKSECNRTDDCIACEMDSLICKLHDGESVPVAPNRLLEVLWRHSKDLAGYEQQDAHELFVTLRSALHSHLGGSMYNCNCVIHCIFSGILQSDLICPSCDHCAETLDPFLDISLDIPPSQTSITLTSCLEQFTKTEVLQVSNFVCSACNASHVDSVKKKLSIRLAPQVLVIHLKRFEHGAATVGASSKVDTPIQFNEYLNITPFMTSSPTDATEYKLFAVVNHVGSLDSGHYTTFVKNRGDWFWVDDACVHSCGLEAVFSRNAYMLFYSRD